MRVHILYFILNGTGSQCRDFNKGVKLQNYGERVTTLRLSSSERSAACLFIRS